METKKRVLVTALNWGLGHAVRLVPIIKELDRAGATVFLAGSGISGRFLQKQFPELLFFELPEHELVYGNNGRLTLAVLWWLPLFAVNIWNEKRAVSKICKSEKIDLIISDNRYGAYKKGVLSVLLIHQLNVQMPSGLGWVRFAFDAIHARLLSSFDKIYVPDEPEEMSLSGILSKPKFKIESTLSYIGYLSDLKVFKADCNYDILFVLSGPEPHRSILEAKIAKATFATGFRAVLVRGTDVPAKVKFPKSMTVYNLVLRNRLNELLLQSYLVVSRSGYTSIMDYVTLGCSAVLVPTPGQTEQEYLATELSKKPQFASLNEADFSIEKVIEKQKGLAKAKPLYNKQLPEVVRSLQTLLASTYSAL